MEVKTYSSTKNYVLGTKHICAYCGKEIKEDIIYDRYNREIIFHCDCEDALKEIELNKKLNRINGEISRKRYEMRTVTQEIDSLRDNSKYFMYNNKLYSTESVINIKSDELQGSD